MSGTSDHDARYRHRGEIRELRRLLARRKTLQRDRNRWQYRARAVLRTRGLRTKPGAAHLRKLVARTLEYPKGSDAEMLEALGVCERLMMVFEEELAHIDAVLANLTRDNDVIERLKTIPGIGPVAAQTLYATIGTIERFSNARKLAAYAGLVPTVYQSGDSERHGRITKEGSKRLRAVLVQSAHVISSREGSEAIAPLRAIYLRIRGTRGRRKIAIVALARHLLRICYYVWRDGTVYDPHRVRCSGT